MGAHVVDRLAVEQDLARARPGQAGDRAEHGRLARPVGADDGEDLAFFDGERDLEEGLKVAVEDVGVLHFEEAHIGVPPM